jgi:hypothetical protein
VIGHHGPDRIGKTAGVPSSPTTGAGYENQAGMASTVRQSPCRDRAKVLDIVGDDRSSFPGRANENLAVGRLSKVGTRYYSIGVQATLAQQTCYGRREMLIQ